MIIIYKHRKIIQDDLEHAGGTVERIENLKQGRNGLINMGIKKTPFRVMDLFKCRKF